MKKDKILKWVFFAISVATFLFIMVNSFLNGDASNAESNLITGSTASAIGAIHPEAVSHDNFDAFITFVRKLFGHFGLFGFFGVFTTLTIYYFKKCEKIRYFLIVGLASLVIGILVASLSEFVQLFVPGRSGSMNDIGINSLGYFIGDLLVILIIFLVILIRTNKSKKEEK